MNLMVYRNSYTRGVSCFVYGVINGEIEYTYLSDLRSYIIIFLVIFLWRSLMIKTVRIQTLEEISEIIFDQAYDSHLKRNRSPFLYRGLPNKNFRLATGLQRNCGEQSEQLERSILRNFTKYASINDPALEKSVWRQLIIGQHHGLPTRLLDWTYSPLVGLHFTTSGEDLSRMNENDAVLWKIDIDEMNGLLPEKYRNTLYKESAHLFTVGMLSSITDNVRGFEDSIAEYDYDMEDRAVVLLEPPSIDQRIISQYSYFSIIPKKIKNIEAFFDNYTSNTVKYCIDKNLKWRIRDMLDQMNINERTVYPGLDGLTTWIKRHFYVRN